MKRIRLPFIDLFKKSSLLFALLLTITVSTNAQTLFSTVADAVNTGGNCYRLTTAEVSKRGAIWYNNKIDLNNNFDISYTLNFGNRSSWSGGDGMAFVLQPAGLTQIGISGSGKGYGNTYDAQGNITVPGISPSVVVEYDTYDDVGGTNGLVSLLLNGDFRRTVPANTPVNQVSMGFVNDGLEHTCRVTWNAGTKTITVYTDGVQRYSYVIDIAASVFSSQNMVYFGFTAGTGGSVNQQSVCYNSAASTFTTLLTLGTPNLTDPCAGLNNGSATINFSGGVAPFTVTLDNNSASTIITSANNATFNNLAAGSHVFTVTDANSVQVSGNFALNSLPAVTATISASGSLTLSSGQSVTLSASAGASYLWNNGAITQSIIVSNAQVGTYTVTVTNGGCSATSSPTTVSAADAAPVIIVPADISVNNDQGVCGALVNFSATETTGNPASVISYSQAPGSIFPVGITAVTATATNSVGVSTKTFNVTVTDNEKPVFVINSPGTATVTIPAMQTFVSSCQMIPFNFSDPLPAGAIVTGVDLTYSAHDQGYGFTDGPDDLYLDGTHIASSVYTHATQTFNTTFTGAIPGYVYGGTNVFGFVFTCYPGWQGFILGGTMTIHYSSAFGPKTINNDAGTCGATVVLSAPPTSDNCGVASVTNDAPATFPVGTTNVTWTATDIHGNTNTITQAITVVDNQPPVVITKDIIVQLTNGSAAITAADIDNGSTDNCGIASYSLDKTSFNCSNVGTNTVTLTVTDIHGNSASATANVMVNGGGSPATVTASGPTTFCSGGSVTLSASAGSSYLWSTGETTQSINVSTSGSYTVAVSNSLNCPSNSAPTVVTVNPISTLTITPANPVICSGSSLTLNSVITNGVGGPVATPIVSSLSADGQTSAKLVVGLRKLVSTYNGPAIRLRRSSDDAESDFGFSGNELDLTAINTFLGGSTGFATTLYDQSGNGGDVTQTNASNQPTFVSNGLNGKPSLYMSSSQFMNNTVNYPSPFTVVYAARQTGPSRSRMLSSVSNNWLLGWWGTLKGIAYYEGWLTLTNGNVSSNGDSNPYVYTGSSDGSNSSFIYQNGTLLASTASGFSGPSGISLNRSGIYGESSDGDFSEVYIFSSVLSTDDRQLVENGAASYYSIYAPSSSIAGPSLTVNPTTTTAYTINAIDVNGCAVSNSITVTVTNIDDQLVTAAPATICGNGSSTVTVGASQLGINYILRNNADNSIVAGPIAGTGSAINFNTGTISATTTYNVLAEKPSGQGSLKFDGNTSYVSVPDNNAYNMNAITLEAMVLFNGSPNIGNVIMKGYYGWGIEIRGDGAIEWWNQFSQTAGPNSTAGAVPIGQWTHIAVTVGGGQTKFYVNGVLNAVANEAIINNNNGALYFGTQGECLCNNFDGKIDEIRIWNTVRTQAEIDANKNACLSGTENGLVSLFKFNDGTGTITADAMGVSNGVLNNFDPATAWSTPNPAITCGSASCSLQMEVTPTVTVDPLSTATITANGPITFCSGGSVTLTANPGTSYLWNTGETTQSITVSTSGIFDVTVSNGACSATSSSTTVTVNPTPATPTISAPGSLVICSSSSVTLTSSAVTGNTWSNGETTQSIIVTQASAGSYTVTVNNGQCSATSAATVVTNAPTFVSSITASGPTLICNGTSVTLTLNEPVPDVSRIWYRFDPDNVYDPTFTATGLSIQVSQSGLYGINIVDANGCISSPANTTVTVNALPVVTITASGPTTFCAGGSVTLTSSSPTGNVWSTGETTQSIVVTQSGSYNVSITNASGCTSNSSNTIVTVNLLPVITISAGGPTTFCTGGSVTLTSSVAAGNVWNTSETTKSIIVTQTGNYSVTVTNANGCTASSANTNVTVNTLPVVTISAGGPTTFCTGGSVTLTSSSATGNVWSSGETTQSIIVTQTGNYSVAVTNANGCSVSSANTNVTVNPLPVVTISIGGPTTFCPGGLVILTSSSSTGNTWSPGGATTASFTAVQSGNYSVKVTDVNGCSATSASVSVTASDIIPPVPSVSPLAALSLASTDPIPVPTATDNCTAGLINASTSDQVTNLSPGTYTIHWTYADNNGNSYLQTQSVTINAAADNTPPAFRSMSSIIKNNDPGVCGAMVVYQMPLANDNASSTKISITEGGGDGTIEFNTPLTNNVSSLDFITSGDYKDIVHGHGTNISVYVELFNPSTGTWVRVQSIQTGSGDYHFGGSSVNFTAITQVSKIRFIASQPVLAAFHFYEMNVNLNSINVVQLSGLPSGSVFPIGNTVNKFQAIDLSGNIAVSSFTVTINDAEKPVIANYTSTSHNADASGTWTGSASTIAISDNCPSSLQLTEQYFDQRGNRFYSAQSTVGLGNYVLGARSFPLGVNTVLVTVRDAAGNVSEAAKFNVTVLDVTNPTIIVSGNINQSSDPGICGAYVKVPVPVTNDNCSIQSVVNSFNGGPGASGRYPVGTTVLIWTVTDGSGNKTTATQAITITDNEAPTIINVPVSVVQTNIAGTCGAVVTWDLVKATDNCGIVSFTSNHQSGETFPLGVTTVTFTAADRNNNTSTASFTITITDNEAPRVITKPITVTLVNGAASILASDINNGSFDNCGGVTLAASKTNFTCADIGTNLVTLTVTDTHGNASSGTAIVTIVGQVPTSIIQVTPANSVYTGGVPTDIYLGYGPQSVTLIDTVTGVTPITYSWTGAGLSCTNCKTPVFTATASGSNIFNVTATNKYGCTTSSSVSVCVMDIRVSTAANSKVYVCHTNLTTGAKQSLTLDVNAVANQLTQNPQDSLGTCGMMRCTPAVAPAAVILANPVGVSIVSPLKEAPVVAGSLTVRVSPNPSNAVFTFMINTEKKLPVHVRIMDEYGRAVEGRDNAPVGSAFTMGNKLISGIYFAEVLQGKERVVIKLIKQNR